MRIQANEYQTLLCKNEKQDEKSKLEQVDKRKRRKPGVLYPAAKPKRESGFVA
jgi:hypothetical protein